MPYIVQPQGYGYGNNIVQGRPITPTMQPMPGGRPMNKPPAMPKPVRVVYSQKTTKNKSFLDMHHYLKSIGIKNNEFMLTLIDPDLDGIDPHDPNLSPYYKQKVLREVMCNYWYYLREVVRVPSAGGAPMKYELHRGNMALNFCLALNLSVFLELPRRMACLVSQECGA